MTVVFKLITLALICNYGFVQDANSQRSGIGLIQTTINSALTKRDSLYDKGSTIIKKIISSSENDTSEVLPETEQVPQAPEVKTNSTENESFTNIKVPDVPSWFGNTKNGTPNVFATKSIQEYIDDALKPVQKSAADVVEGAVKTGVDQAMSSITDNFQIDVYLVGAVLVIQVVLCGCGAHLFYYVYQREREMRSYVKQQIGMNKIPCP